MAFGVKIKSVKTNKPYTIEEFYEAIKDKTFTAGKPELVKNGLAMIVVFPALDSQNQVQIVPASMKKEAQKFQIQKAEQAGVANMVGNMALDKLTGGLFGFKQIAGKNAKRCEELVEITAKELEALGL